VTLEEYRQEYRQRRRAYERRLDEIAAEMDVAQARGDLDTVDRLTEELLRMRPPVYDPMGAQMAELRRQMAELQARMERMKREPAL
jgi:chromosome segregation ATPase